MVEKAEAEGRGKDRGFVVGSGERQGDDGRRRRRPPPPPPGRAASRRTVEAAGVPTVGRGRGGRARSPFLGRYAAIQKRTAVAAVLDFTGEEWKSLKAGRWSGNNDDDCG